MVGTKLSIPSRSILYFQQIFWRISSSFGRKFRGKFVAEGPTKTRDTSGYPRIFTQRCRTSCSLTPADVSFSVSLRSSFHSASCWNRRCAHHAKSPALSARLRLRPYVSMSDEVGRSLRLVWIGRGVKVRDNGRTGGGFSRAKRTCLVVFSFGRVGTVFSALYSDE